MQNPKSTPWDKLYAIVDVYVERFFTNKAMVQIIFKEISSNKRAGLSKHVSTKMMNNFSVIENIIDEGVKKKVFKKTDSAFLIMTMFGTLMIYINSNMACLKMSGATSIEDALSEPFKQRMKEHLKNLLKNQLTK